MSVSSLGSSLTVRTSWLVAAKTVAFAFTIAIPLLLVRRMPQHEFGLYKQVFLIVNSAVSMLPLGFGLTAFYFLPREEDPRRRNQTVFNVVLFTAAVSSLFAAVLSLFPGILILLFTEPAVVEFAPWIGLIIVLWVVGSFLEIVTVANHDIRIATAAILAIQVSRATFFLTAAIVAGSVRALVFAAVVQGVLQVSLLVLYLRNRFPGFWTSLDLSFLRRQLAYSLPFGAAGLMYSLQTDLHNYFVSHRFGAAVYAVYAIGCFQLPFFGILAESVGSVMIPRVSLLQHQQRTREIVLLTTGVMRKLAAVYFPAYAFLMIMRYEFVTALFTARYIASVPVFAVNLTLIPLGIFMTDPIMRAYAEHRHFVLKIHAALLVCLTIGLSMSIGRFGLLGAITLVVLCNALGRAATLMKVIRILDVRPRDIILLADVGKIAGAAAAAGLVSTLVRSLASGLPPIAVLFMCGSCFGIAYVTAALGLGIATQEERAFVLNYLWRAIGRSPAPLVQAATLVRD
jgi:O-antigen/teichoic acid export membrane protein